MINHEQKIFALSALKILFLVILGVFIATVINYYLLNGYDFAGWVLNSEAKSLSENLTPFEKYTLGELVLKKNVVPVNDIIGNFTSYYNFLISILLTIIVFLGGFLTFSFYKSKEEHDGVLKYRINELIEDFDRDIEKTEGHLDKYRSLNDYLEKRIIYLTQNSEDLQEYISWATDNINQEAIDQAIVNTINDAFLRELCEKIKCANGEALVVSNKNSEGE